MDSIAENSQKCYNKRKSYDELEFTDDFLFGKLMQNETICKGVLEVILGLDIQAITYPEIQKTVGIRYDAKSIRLDVYVNDDAGTVYNVEMQTSVNSNLLKRCRYYQGLIDMDLLQKGEDYKKLNKSFIIFICTDDPFGEDLPLYTFQMQCMETELHVTNDAKLVVMNARGVLEKLETEEQRAFWRYVSTRKATDAFTGMLEENVEKSRHNEDWRRDFMKMNLLLKEEKEKSFAEGKAEGVLKTLIKLVCNGILSMNQAAEEAGMSLSEFQASMEMYKKR